MKQAQELPWSLHRGARIGLWSLSLLALGAFVWGLGAQPDRAWVGLLMAFLYLVALGLGACIFIAIHFAANANWATALRRVPEAMVPTLELAALLLIPILALGLPHIYAWARPGVVQADPVLALKAAWFGKGFFSARSLLFLATWAILMGAVVRHSRRQDQDGLGSHRSSSVRLSMIFLGVFALSFPIATMDWIMSLEPRWYSTIFGIYAFAGTFQVGLAMIILLLLFLRSQGAFAALRTEHLHDLGKLLFAFSNFWAYMWFSQYMLIWYADQRDEISYYAHRDGAWFALMMVLVVVKFGIPFMALLSQPAKRNAAFLGSICVLVLAGHWLDLAVLILPITSGKTPSFGLMEVLLPLGALAAFLLLFFRNYARHPSFPLKDAGLAESLSYH